MQDAIEQYLRALHIAEDTGNVKRQVSGSPA